MIRTALAALFLAVYAVIVGLPLVLYAAVTGSINALFWAGRAGTIWALRVAGIRIRAEGLENIPGGTCLFAANHTSNADPPSVVGAIPRRIAILAKKSLFSIPIVGVAFRLAHFVPVNRADSRAAMGSIDEAAGHMKNGTSYLIYPEGTRSPDGRLLPFKRGAFVLAIRAGVPVVPVACSNAHRILPKNSWRVRPGEIVVRFCPPVDAAAYREDQRGELAARVHAAIAAGLPEDQRPLAPVSE
jgi:1-acyl-sn-glycerol-3-phosphate acyltransferase